MLSYYSVADALVQSGAFANFFGGEEGAKQVPQILFINPKTIISKGNSNNTPPPVQ